MKATKDRKNKIRTGVFALLAALFVVSCTDDFNEINTPLDPRDDRSRLEGFGVGIHLGDSITPEELKQIQGDESSLGETFRKFLYEGVYNDYQITTNLTHDIYAGYFANLNPSWIMDAPTYMYHAGWSDARWEHFYVQRTTEYGRLIRAFWFLNHDFKAKTGAYLNAFYITRIYYAFLISMQADTYGDIPLTDKQLRGLSDPVSSAFRPQREIYKIIFELLDDALTNINPDKKDSFDLSDIDRGYKGDVNKWIRFGNTLRLRLALRLSNADPEMAKREGELALAHPGGLMKSQEDNLRTIPKFAPLDQGGENSGGDENIYALCSYKWYDAGMNKDIEVAYRTLSSEFDPRCKISWYRPLEVGSTEHKPIESDRDFLGSQSGDFDIQKPSYKHSLLRSYAENGKQLRDDAWFGYSRECVWLSYAESKFLLAEASLRGWKGAMGKEPLDYFIEGITESMRYYKIPYAEELMYIAGLKVLQDPATNPFVSNDKEKILEQIITHKWLAVFPNGNEGWAEFRRTDYPSFVSLPLINSSGGGVPEGKFIKRVSYPSDAIENNEHAVYVPTGVRVWWDVADTNDNGGKRQQPNNIR